MNVIVGRVYDYWINITITQNVDLKRAFVDQKLEKIIVDLIDSWKTENKTEAELRKQILEALRNGCSAEKLMESLEVISERYGGRYCPMLSAPPKRSPKDIDLVNIVNEA